eukprot:UN4432
MEMTECPADSHLLDWMKIPVRMKAAMPTSTSATGQIGNRSFFSVSTNQKHKLNISES